MHRHHVAAAEVAHQDQWQRAVIGVAAVSGSYAHLVGCSTRSTGSCGRIPRSRSCPPIGGGSMRRAEQSQRKYPRTARVNELCREILGDALERLDDDRLQLVTVTHVTVDPDLRHALVEFSSLGEGEDEAAEALAEHRVRLQSAIARQARLKRTPELRFQVDTVIARGARIDELLRDDRDPEDDD
jgi:ribosome-binding factor A